MTTRLPSLPRFRFDPTAIARIAALLLVWTFLVAVPSTVSGSQETDPNQSLPPNAEGEATATEPQPRRTRSLMSRFGSGGRSAEAPPSVVAHFHLRGLVVEKPREDPFGFLGGQLTSMHSLLKRLEKARQDDTVEAVVITYDGTLLGLAQMEELHRELLRFRETGKPVLAQIDSTSLSVPTFALLSAASELVVDPMADFWITGLHAESLHLKTLLDTIGVDADFLQFEEYKSAAELMTRTEPSEAARQDLDRLLDGVYDSLTTMIARARGVEPEAVRRWIDHGLHRAPAALEAGMVDAAEVRDSFLDSLRERFDGHLRIDNRYGEERLPGIDFNNPFAFFSLFSQMAGPRRRAARDTVALVYAEGMILPGYGQSSPFGAAGNAYSGDIRHALETAAADPSVKAVVMRIDSPGGSVLASEIIMRALREVGETKPVVVSMGNVAASGGYYIACGADEIYANETTLTGSIGIVGGKLITQGMWEKLGVNWVPFQRGKNADFFTSNRRFTEVQRERFREWLEESYTIFKNRVVEARGERLAAPVDEIAGGRVYTGRQALEHGLVDRIGGLSAALDRAAERAGIAQYAVRVIPEPKSPLEEIVSLLAGDMGERPHDLHVSLRARNGAAGATDATSFLLPSGTAAVASRRGGPPSIFPPVASNRETLFASVLPMLRSLDPVRAHAVVSAFGRIELLRREGVAYLLPYDVILHP